MDEVKFSEGKKGLILFSSMHSNWQNSGTYYPGDYDGEGCNVFNREDTLSISQYSLEKRIEIKRSKRYKISIPSYHILDPFDFFYDSIFFQYDGRVLDYGDYGIYDSLSSEKLFDIPFIAELIVKPFDGDLYIIDPNKKSFKNPEKTKFDLYKVSLVEGIKSGRFNLEKIKCLKVVKGERTEGTEYIFDDFIYQGKEYLIKYKNDPLVGPLKRKFGFSDGILRDSNGDKILKIKKFKHNNLDESNIDERIKHIAHKINEMYSKEEFVYDKLDIEGKKYYIKHNPCEDACNGVQSSRITDENGKVLVETSDTILRAIYV